MIKNNDEYQNTRYLVGEFQKSIAAMEKDRQSKNDDFQKWEINRSALQSHLEKLQEEIVEYERILNCNTNHKLQIKVDSLNKLPDALIKARIAAKMTQQELADILGIDEQQVKQYEKTDYQCASFVDILEVSTALGVEFENAVVQVDFEEIKEVKKTVEKWRKEKTNIKTKAS
ncbi:helix-turn-helix domain-containing protein [Scytonema sp. UIC 10036]|uniref:helix-turn-helix transcriptional regulator n=1 Tax=Scytonema sp. UIC 10036 TaxID=2304196 RepID=UPI0012DA5FE7|nr:helix-turn-helix transcriptional regulator [Scytonema sp. UIC 10036]MUH01848.1 helix-turn-helix domain-containing protein [Scytonema sp. UIC 10036]